MIVVCGDIGPSALAVLRSRPDPHCIRGNADREDRIDADLPPSLGFVVDGLGAVRFCHAVPGDDESIITRRTPPGIVAALLADTAEHVVRYDHTHVQYDRRVGEHRVVNCGSVGLPYEAEPGAHWVMLGPDVDFRRTIYTAASLPEATPDEAAEHFERLAGRGTAP